MPLFLKRFLLFALFATVCLAAGTGTFVALEWLAEERENPGMLVSRGGLFRKISGNNALFLAEHLSPKTRRVVLALTREPQNEAELKEAKTRVKELSKILPAGNFLLVADDTGKILLQRKIPKTRKIFDLSDEIKILSARLKSVPVMYFPVDSLRGKIRSDIFEGNAEYPAPAGNGGGQ